MRHKAGKENETQTKHTGRNIVRAVVVVLAAFCAYAAALVHSAMVIKDEVTLNQWVWCVILALVLLWPVPAKTRAWQV